jgi:hypothetical protein
MRTTKFPVRLRADPLVDVSVLRTEAAEPECSIYPLGQLTWLRLSH